jgi:hypothetical protein
MPKVCGSERGKSRGVQELQEFRRGRGACLASPFVRLSRTTEDKCEAESAVSAKELRFGSEHYPIATPLPSRFKR